MIRAGVPLVLLVAACAPHPTSVASAAGCDAAAVQRFVGQAADASSSEALRLSGARMLRRYASGDMLTMDYRADRLNIEADGDGRIVKLSCG